MCDEFLGTVARVEEIGVHGDTYLGKFIDEFDSEFNASLCVFFVETKAKRVSGFVVGVEGVDEVLAPDVSWDGIIVEFPSLGDVFADFVREGVVDDDETFTGPRVSLAC